MARPSAGVQYSRSLGRWERSKFEGVEVYEKTLGVQGFGRIGQLVATRARLRHARRRGGDQARDREFSSWIGTDADLPGCLEWLRWPTEP